MFQRQAMFLGRVVGTCVASEKYPGLTGLKLLVLESIDPTGHRSPAGSAPFVAVDTVGAGYGEIVYWVGAREASLALDESFVPVDAAIVGLIDEIHRPSLQGFLRGRDELPRDPEGGSQ